MPVLNRIPPDQNKDIYVLFYGSINKRRENILHSLSEAGLNVHIAFNKYGRERDALIAKSKIVLNLHHYNSHVFESVRVSYLLANSKAVVSECGTNTEIDPLYKEAIMAVQYNKLVEVCIDLINNPIKRHELENKAFSFFISLSEADILSEAIEQIFPHGTLNYLSQKRNLPQIFCDNLCNFIHFFFRNRQFRVGSLT